MPFDAQAVLARLKTRDHVDTCYSGRTDFYEPCTCPPGKGDPTAAELEGWLRQALIVILNGATS